MARGTGLTTKMLEEIDWSSEKPIIIVVHTAAMRDHVKHLLTDLYKAFMPRKVEIILLLDVRSRLLGRRWSDIYIDHAVEGVMSDELVQCFAWLKEFIRTRHR